MIYIVRFIVGFYLGLCSIAGILVSVQGILIFALQCYIWLNLQFWPSISLMGVYRAFDIAIPNLTWPVAQKIFSWVLGLPASLVLVLVGVQIVIAAKIARRNIMRRTLQVPRVIAAQSHGLLVAHGVSTLHIHR